MDRKALGKAIEAIKDAAINGGADNVSIDLDTGEVFDQETGEPIGNVHDELD